MKSNFKIACLIAANMFFAGKLFGQAADTTAAANSDYVKPFSHASAYRTWSIGVNGGIMSTFSVLNSNDKLDFTLPNIQYGYGGYIKKQILPGFGIQADLLMGKLNGDDAQPATPGGVPPYKSFSTSVYYAGDIAANFTLANINWQFMKSTIQPYITSGIGTMIYKPTVTTSLGVTRNFKSGNGDLNEMYLPIGVGVKFNVSRGINLEFGYQLNFVYSDNLDGYKYGNNNDKFSYAHVGLEFAIGKRSKPQLAAHNPVASMRNEYLGEIQSAKDAMQAQLDSEKVKNQALQQQINTTNIVIAKLTTDTDGDGVVDFFDKCPDTPPGTKVDASGCPLPAPKPEEIVYVVTEADKQVVNEAVRNLEFETGKATIAAHSYASLETLSKLLADKKFHLKLAGYTDSRGSTALNLQLSKDRAEAVKMFMVNHGADGSLIQTEGYGKAHPIASNKTARGRKLNRRVEFTLF
jgi:OOP family OmpA-OmpF porin